MIYYSTEYTQPYYSAYQFKTDVDTWLPYDDPEFGYCMHLSDACRTRGIKDFRDQYGRNNLIQFNAFHIEDEHYRKYTPDEIEGDIGIKNLVSLNDIIPIFKAPTKMGLETVIPFSDDCVGGMKLPNRPHLMLARPMERIVGSDDSRVYIMNDGIVSYMFDKKLAKLLDDPEIKVKPVTINIRLAGLFTSDDNMFMMHVVYCKTRKKMEIVRKYFQKRYNAKVVVAYREASEHYMIDRINRIRTLVDDHQKIKVGGIGNKNMLYGFKISVSRMNELGVQDRVYEMVYERKELHYVLKAGTHSSDKSETLDVYARDSKIINKMKLLSMWRDIIEEVTVNDIGQI